MVQNNVRREITCFKIIFSLEQRCRLCKNSLYLRTHSHTHTPFSEGNSNYILIWLNIAVKHDWFSLQIAAASELLTG